MSALTVIGLALGVEPGRGGECAICGHSPFDMAGDLRKLSPNFTDTDSLRHEGGLCCGCERILSGRPGDTPPPLRTVSFVVVDGKLKAAKATELWAIIEDPADCFVLSWAKSRKRHHALHAGVSTPGRMVIGSDTGPVVYMPARHGRAANAVAHLRSGFTQAEILGGAYPPTKIQRFGASEWQREDTEIAGLRGSRLLDFLVAARPAEPPTKEETTMVSETLHRAAELVSFVAEASELRRQDGIAFWKSWLKSRLARGFKAKNLSAAVGRLADEISCDPLALAPAMQALEKEQEEQALFEEIRTKPALVVALAYQKLRERKAK